MTTATAPKATRKPAAARKAAATVTKPRVSRKATVKAPVKPQVTIVRGTRNPRVTTACRNLIFAEFGVKLPKGVGFDRAEAILAASEKFSLIHVVTWSSLNKAEKAALAAREEDEIDGEE